MKKLALALLLVCPIGLLSSSGPAARQVTDPKSVMSQLNPQARPIPIDDLYYSRSTGGGAWSPDGKEVVFTTNLSGRLNLWKVNASGGFPVQLSQSDDRQSAAVWSRDGRWIVYEQDRGGGEIYDLFAIPSNGGAATNLTNTPEISETSPHFSPDGSKLTIGLKPRVSPVTDLGVLDWKTRATRNLTQEKTKDHIWTMGAWSPDSKYVYAIRVNAGFTDSDVYRIDAESGATENLTPHQGQVRYASVDASPDGRVLLVTSDAKGGYSNVALLDLASKRIRWVTDTQWEARANRFSPDGKTFTYELNQDGRTSAFMCGTATLDCKQLSMPEGLNAFAGNPSPYSPDGGSLLMSHQSSTRIGDLWIYDLAGRKPRQLTYSAIASLNPDDLPPSQLVHYKSFDGTIISAFLWVPFNLARNSSAPGIVLPHGGPTGQTVDSFNRTVAALVSRGYVCITPNVRGSTGYGMQFQKANYQDLGGGDLQDEVYATRFMVDTGYVDAKKIGITGGSYGGFMTLMAIGKTPQVWAAAVELFGIIDWYTMLQHEDPFLQEYEKSLLGDPVQDKQAYENSSPIKYIRDARAPLLVLQGENDIRVPKEEAEQVVRILKEENKTVDAVYYPGEGHGFFKREHQVDAIRRTVEWFDKYLKQPSPRPAAK